MNATRRALAGALVATLMVVASSPASARVPAGAVVPAAASPSRTDSARDAASWIVAQQKSGGAFFSEDQPADATAETIVALVSAGVAGAPVERALRYVERTGRDRATRAAYAGRIVMGLVAAGRDPRSFGGVDYVKVIEDAYNPATGTYETGLYSDALAILGLVAARRPVPAQAITYLRANQCPDGGFAHDPGCIPKADTDTTSMVIAVAAGAGTSAGVAWDDAWYARARSWLRSALNDDGGYPHTPGGATNANSTGLALSAIAATRQSEAAWSNARGVQPGAGFASLRHGSGGFKYQAGDRDPNGYATVQIIPGLMRAAYPVRPAAAARSGTTPPSAKTEQPSSRNPATGVMPSPQPCPAPLARATGERRAGLIVEHANGSVRTFCIAFSAAEEQAGFSGADLLVRSGIPVIFGGTRTDASVSAIDGEGCGAADSFCECPNAAASTCRFWGYYAMDSAGAWQFASRGAAQRLVRDGDVDGWRYGNHLSGNGGPGERARPCANGARVLGLRQEAGLRPRGTGGPRGTSAGGPHGTGAGGGKGGPLAAGALTLVFGGGAAWAAARRRRRESL